MGLRFFPVVARFFRSAKIIVAIRQGQKLEHHERVGLRHANLCCKSNSVGEVARDGVFIGLSQRNGATRTGARVADVIPQPYNKRPLASTTANLRSAANRGSAKTLRHAEAAFAQTLHRLQMR
jgi:hypothetical protein